MSRRIDTKTLHWDLAQALAVMAAAMLFLPPLRKILMWPTAGVFVILAGVVVVMLLKAKAAPVSYNRTPAPALQIPTGATEMRQKALLDKINHLDWLPFEQLACGLYSTLGYEVRRFGGPHADGGVDLMLLKNKSKTLAQCKHWKVAEVDEQELKEFLGTLTRERIEDGIFVTPREFSFGARRFAAMNNLLLVGARDLLRMLEEAGWEENPALRAAVEQSRKFCPRCQKDMVLRNAEGGPNPGARVWVCTAQPKCSYTLNA